MKKLLIILGVLLAAALLFSLPGSQVQAQNPDGEEKPPVPDSPPVPSKEDILQIAIVGGEAAEPNEWPWQVRVHPGPFLCGGTLINEEWVLTAAHCITDNNGGVISPDTVKVVLGDHSKSSDTNDGTEQVYDTDGGILQVIRHPDYNPATTNNDIALLQLSSQANLITGTVETIPLNDNDSLSAGTLATVTGWGTTSSGGSTPDILQEVSVPLVSNQTCNASYGNITPNMLCAGFAEGGKDSCQGDSGGPLVIPDGNGGWVHAGVVSFGNGCALPNFYGVYARTSKFVTWIEEQIGSDTGPPPPPPPPTSDIIQDGDFELFSGDWSEFSSNDFALIGNWFDFTNIAAASGDNYVWFGGADDEFSEVSQTVNLPDGGTLTLTFNYQINSEDICGYDFGRVIANGSVLATYDLCQDTNTTSWVEETLDLSSFGGETVTLSFSSESDSSGLSSFFVDLVAIEYTDTPPPPPTPGTGPVPNGDFELGQNGDWTESSSNGFDLILSNIYLDPFSGSYLAWLGGLDDEISTLSQDVTVPDSGGSQTLVFYYQIGSEDFCGFDFTEVRLNNQLLTDPYDLCAEENTDEWQLATFDVSDLAGQTVPLEFRTETDDSFFSSFFIDDVAITDTPPTLVEEEEPEFVLTADPGSGNIELNWTVTSNSNVETYRVNRRAEGETDFTPIETTTETTYFDEDGSLVEEEEYRYRVEALDGENAVVATSNVATAIFGQLVLRIPQAVAATDEEVIVPINISNADGLQIGASDIWIDYDSNVVIPVGVEETALTTGYTWLCNCDADPNDPDIIVDGSIKRLKISLLGTNPPEIYGDGSLFWITFQAVGSDNARSSLNLRGLQEGLLEGPGTNIFNSLLTEIDLELNDGRLTVQNPPEAEFIFGDVNGDTNIGAVDALTAMRIAVRKINPNNAQKAAGDINGNGSVQAADAAMILYRAVNNDWPPLPTQSAAELAAQSSQTQQITMELADIIGAPGATVQTTLEATDLQDFAGGDITVVYNTDLIDSFTNVEKTGLINDFQLFDWNDDGEGRLYISLANDQPISGSGPIATLTVKLSSNPPGLLAGQGASSGRMHLADAEVSNQNGLDFETNFANNQIILNSAVVTVTDEIDSGGDYPVYLPVVIK